MSWISDLLIDPEKKLQKEKRLLKLKLENEKLRRELKKIAEAEE